MRRRRAGDWPHVVVLDPESAGLALGRAMVRAGARVTHVVVPGHELETHSRGVEHVVAPFADDGAPWLEAVQRLAARDRGELAVLPMTDRGSALLALERERLPPNVRAFERSGDAHLALMDKQAAEGIARGAGVAVPWTTVVERPEELEAATTQAPWPCIVKPVLSHVWRNRYSEERAFVVQDAQEAAQVMERPLRDGVAMLLCQYVPGGDADVEEAILVRLADGSYPVCFGCRKLRQSPPGRGATSLGVSDPLPETTTIARAVLEAAGFVGVAGVETKRDPGTGRRWFLEVNVRVPAQWGLGDACGAEASTRLVAALARRELGPAPTPRAGVGIVVPVQDVRVIGGRLRELPARRRPLELLRLLRPYVKVRELGLLDPRDPGPGLAWAGAVARRRLSRRWPGR